MIHSFSHYCNMTTAHHSMLKWPWMQYVSWLQVELFTLANHVISSFFASMNCERSWKNICIGKQTCMSKHFWLFCRTNLQSSLCLGRHSWTAEQLSNELSLTSSYMVSSFSIFWKLIKYSIYKDKNLFLVQGEKVTDPHTCTITPLKQAKEKQHHPNIIS